MEQLCVFNLQPSQHGSQAGNQMVSVFYTMLIPTLNTLKFEKLGSESSFMENIEAESLIFHFVSQECNMFYEDLLTVLFTVFSLPANEALLRTI